MKLKPCPFCGCEEVCIKKYYVGTIEKGAAIKCPNCHIEMGYQNATCAIMVCHAWNRRAEDVSFENLTKNARYSQDNLTEGGE